MKVGLCDAGAPGRARVDITIRADGRRGSRQTFAHAAGAALVIAALGGCALEPPGAEAERSRLANAGTAYETSIEARTLPELPESPTWRDALHRALLANGELEAAYFEWQAAVQRVEMASAYPNSNVQLGYSYMFSSERMKSFDRQTFSAGFDPSMSLELPSKVRQRGRLALDEARAAGEKFRAMKFDVQRRVLSSWAELERLARAREIQRERLALARLGMDLVRAAARAGGVQRDLVRAEEGLRTLENALLTLDAEHSATRAMLNAMLARDPHAPLSPAPDRPRAFAASDDQVLLAAAERNPELGALAQQVRGRADALELARLRWLPDVSASIMATGSVSQALDAMVMLPTAVREIRGGIREAEAMLRAGEAMLRQARSDRAATVVGTLVALRNDERQGAFFEGTLLPLGERAAALARRAYASGAGSYADVIEAEGMSLDVRSMIAEARASREKRLAELEALMGTDIETVACGVPAASIPSAAIASRADLAPATSQEATHEP